jgi:hypothetical protein
LIENVIGAVPPLEVTGTKAETASGGVNPTKNGRFENHRAIS